MMQMLYWSLVSLRRRLLRSALAAAAIGIGIWCLTVCVGVMIGVHRAFSDFVNETGALDIVTVGSRQLSLSDRLAPPLSERDANFIKRYDDSNHVGAALTWFRLGVSAQGKVSYCSVSGVTSETLKATRHECVAGRGISDIDNERNARVVVLGQKAVRELFPRLETAVGSQVEIFGARFTVVGVLRLYEYYDGSGDSEMPFKNGYCFIPLKTAQELSLLHEHVSYIHIRSEKWKPISELRNIANSALWISKRTEAGRKFETMDAQIQQWEKTNRGVQIGLSVLTVASLVIAATSVANVQLTAVAERVKEYGVRRAIGATRWDIRKIVLVETVILSLCGGLGGVIIAVITIPTIAALMPSGVPGAPVLVWWCIPAALLSSILVGVASAMYPAVKAGRLDPVEAIRTF